MKSRRALALLFFGLLSAPLLAASADSADPASSSAPAPSGSASAAPRSDALSAAALSGSTKAPPDQAWKDAVAVTGIRMGADADHHGCRVTHIAEWVRVSCGEMNAARVDLLAGEKRDLTIIGSPSGSHGEDMSAQFSMRPGDRRILQWIMSDLWSQVWPGDNGEWMSGGSENRGPMLGVSVQVDWASGPEPIIAIY